MTHSFKILGFENHLAHLVLLVSLVFLGACGGDDPALSADYDKDIIENTFGAGLKLAAPFDYENQTVPDYINDDNTGNNPIVNEVATLGRVLFYDKSLSVDNSVSCSSCHQQIHGFSDQDQVSQGVNGVTGRHSMRLINARFADEDRFFWDERAATLEDQSTMPIQDHNEMGFSGEGGDPGIADLLDKLGGIDYYPELFTYAFGSEEITEAKMQTAISQFVRSIQSFDSKYDQGRSQVNDRHDSFANFSDQENLGKALFMGPEAGCDRCHQGDEFDIDQNSGNNGVIAVAGDDQSIDTGVTRAPTLRDLFNPNGELNGPLMHDGGFTTLEAVIAHYSAITIDAENDNLDPRLSGMPGMPPGTQNGTQGQVLNLDESDVAAIVAFVKTLSGQNVYTDEKWSDPFEN